MSFTIWLYVGFQAVDLPDGVLEDDRYVSVATTDQGVEFRGRVNPQRIGIIFLPGGAVDPMAYTPLLRKIAGAGYPARLLYLPMRCACTDGQVRELFQNVRQVIQSESNITWILAGHSRGAMLATRYAHEGGAGLAGLVLIATTHPRDFSLADVTMPVTRIYGTSDGVATYDRMRQNQHLLPQSTAWVEIAGGNHVQFGYYRHQLGDGRATISRDEQQQMLVAVLLKVLSSANHR